MLRAETAFPQQGSYALLPEGSDTHLVRINHRPNPAEAIVTFPLPPGATGTRRGNLADLVDGTPLTEAEAAELDRLTAKRNGVLGRGQRPRRDQRYDELAARAGNASLLAELRREANLLISKAA